MKQFSYGGKSDELIFVEDGFTFPSMSKQVQYHDNTQSSYRRRRRSISEPFAFSIPIMIFKKNATRNELNERISVLLNSKGPQILEFEDVDWYLIGEFNGPYEIPNTINYMTSFELEFTSSYSHKFYKGEQSQVAGKTVTIDTKTQIPTIPLIELTGLTGSDVQISNSKKDGSFKRIRLTGTLPSGITIDPQRETIFTTSTGTERLDLLRIDSNFEDFTLEDGDVITLTNAGETASAKLTYKELML